MPLSQLQTSVSSQPYISGALSADNDFTQKFSKGGIANGTNGISDTSIMIPKLKDVGSKKQILYQNDSNTTQQTDEKKQSVSTYASQAKINDSFAISSLLPEPLAIFSFKKDEVQNLLAASYQAFLEDKCSLSFSEKLIQLIQESNPKAFDSVKSNLKSQIKEVRQIVDQIASVNLQSNNFDLSLSSRSPAAIKEICSANFSSFSPDNLIPSGELAKDPYGILKDLVSNENDLVEKSQTALVNQTLQLAAQTFSNGCTPNVLNEKIYEIPKGENSVSSKSIRESQAFPTLASISLKDDASQTFLYGMPELKETQTYLKRLKLDKFNQVPEIRKAAYFVSMLANEFAISTGLGRLENTQLGQSFGSTADYLQNFLGVRGMANALDETTAPSSLSDYLVVSEDGTSQIGGSTGVLLLDGSNFKSTLTRKNSYDSFVSNVVRDPLNPNANKVQQLEKALVSALARYELGAEFYKKLHLRDQKLSLLTPRGLFTRLLKDFSDSIDSLLSESISQKQIVRELAILSIISRQSTSDVSDSSPVSLIKRRLVSQMSLKACLTLYGTENVNQKYNDPEVIQKYSNLVSSGDAILNEKKIRFSADDVNLVLKRYFYSLDQKTLASLPALDLGVTSDGPYVEFTTLSFFSKVLEGENGFLEKIVQIFIDMNEEADKICKQDGKNNSFVNVLRLTKNSQLDGTLAMSMLFEAACSLCGIFIDASKPLTFVNGLNTLSSNAVLAGDFSEDFDTTSKKVVQIKVNLGDSGQLKTIKKALSAIAASSLSNSFDSLVNYTNQGAVVPEIDNKSISYTISTDKVSNLSIGTMIDVMKDLSFERDIPAACISSAKASFEFARDSSKKVVSTGKQILGVEKRDEQTTSFVSFAETSLGQNYLSSVNDFNLSISLLKIAEIEKSLVSPSGRGPKMPRAIYNCLRDMLPEVMAEKSSAFFVVAALPVGFVKDSLNSGYSLKKDAQNSLQDETMSIVVDRNPIFSEEVYESLYRNFFVRNTLNDDSFSSFESSTGISVNNILSMAKFSDLGTGAEIIQKKNDKATTIAILQNETVSYLLRRMFSVLSSADLFPQNISSNFSETRSQSSRNIAKFFASAYGLPESIFDSIFVEDAAGNTVLSKDALLDLSVDKFKDGNSSIVVKHAPITFGEAELFYDVFSTIYFYEGQISNIVFSPSLFDRTIGVLCSQEDFASTTSSQELKLLGNKLVSNSDLKLAEQQNLASGNPDVFGFDTYSIEILPSEPLVST